MLSKILSPLASLSSLSLPSLSTLTNLPKMSFHSKPKAPFKPPTTDILILSEKDIRKVFTMKDAIQASKDSLKIYSSKQANIPLRANLDVPEHEGQCLYMYGYASPANALGVKIVSVYPKNIEKGIPSVPATMILVNSKTGQVNCIMEGTYLTRIRTGAISGAATDVLAKEDSKVFTLFGTGGQAPTQLEAVLNVRPIELVKVSDMSKERAKDFALRMSREFGDKYNVKIEVAKNQKDAVMDADIITTVTTAKKKIFDGKLVKKGCHINGVGSYTPAMSEIDEYIITHADKIFVDTNDAIKESGDLIKPINKGIFSAEDVKGELGNVLLGNVTGRESDDEITFFETTGSAVLDIVTGQKIYENAIRKQMGKIVKL